MPRGPTEDEIRAILALDSAAGSHDELMRWIAISRKQAKTRRGRPRIDLDDELIKATELAYRRNKRKGGRIAFQTLLRANAYMMFGTGDIPARQQMIDRVLRKRRRTNLRRI